MAASVAAARILIVFFVAQLGWWILLDDLCISSSTIC